MQSEIFQDFICYNFDDYDENAKCERFKITTIITNKGLKYLTLHVISLYNILVSPFKLNY